MITIKKTVSKFTDLDASLTKHPIRGDLMTKKDVEAIKFAIRNLIMTGTHEKPFHPERATPISEMLFENYDNNFNKSMVAHQIKYLIDAYEPRAILKEVTFDDGRITLNELTIGITFQPINTSEDISFNVILQRLR